MPSTSASTSEHASSISSPAAGRVVTLGMFIIDRFEYSNATPSAAQPDKQPEEQMGGGGTYAMVGARLFLPPTLVGIIIDVGTDFPPDIMTNLKAYGDEMFAFRKRDRLTTRALNLYSGEERGSGHQSFRYLTPKLRISPLDILNDTAFTSAGPPSDLHFVCSPERAGEIVTQLGAMGWGRTRLVWEPMPSDCVPSELNNLEAVAGRIDVLSPNHLEALTLLSVKPSESISELVSQIEAASKTLASYLTRPGSSVVIRSGGVGVCYSKLTDQGVSNPVWIPAVFGPEDQSRVRDVTGGGNAFLGGLCAGLRMTAGDIDEAVLYGSVAASYAIEQHGLPTMNRCGSQEIWNGIDTGEARLAAFRASVQVGHQRLDR